MGDIVFAYRYCIIEAARPSASGQWAQRNSDDPGKPPIEWRGGPLPREWRVWNPGRPGQQLRDKDVTHRDTFSLVWCQLNQRYWVVPEDCTRIVAVHGDPEREQEIQDRWQPLHCRHLTDPEKSRPGLWQLVDWGTQRQHSSSCPLGFDEFLPRNFFTGMVPNAPCHFIGHLSLILALLAMCPEDPTNIPTKIDRYFYRNHRPLFVPSRSHEDSPMDRHALPARGVVMQTAVINRESNSTEEILGAWEGGRWGPLVSSRDPTQEELRRWGVRPWRT